MISNHIDESEHRNKVQTQTRYMLLLDQVICFIPFECDMPSSEIRKHNR